VRVIAGLYGGRRLTRPPGHETRPTADRVREALFSMLGDLEDADVLDLYAGSGALGIESLSRGAASAVFVDSAREAAETIEGNLETLHAHAEVHRRDVFDYLRVMAGQRRYDLVMVDPPYDSAVAAGAALSELLPAVLHPQAFTVTESHKRAPLQLPFPVIRERTYGNTRIVIHRGR